MAPTFRRPHWARLVWAMALVVRLKASPLLAAMRAEDDSRYLTGFGRDFFYVTLAGPG